MTHYVFSSVDSTSSEARRRVVAREALPFAVSARCQRAGRGRQGKHFHSPEGGIYLTVALPADLLPHLGAVPLTVRAAVSVARSIEKVTGLSLGIKWVNDLYLDGKKVAGILTEAVPNPETGTPAAVLLGVGINLAPPSAAPDFPDDLSLAGGLFSAPCAEELREAMMQEVIAGLLRDLAVEGEEFLPEYRRRSTVLGRPVAFWQNRVRYEGVATDIDGEGALLVKMGEETARLTSGEITLRPL